MIKQIPDYPLKKSMIINKISPSIHWAQRHRTKSGNVLDNRRIYDFELLYVQGGRGKAFLDNRSYDWEEGQLFYFRPGMPHSIIVTSPEACFLGIHYDYFDELDISKDEDIIVNELNIQEGLFCSEPYKQHGELLFHHLVPNPLAVSLMVKVVDEFTLRPPFYELNCKALFIQLLVQLLRLRPIKLCQERYIKQVMELTSQIQRNPSKAWSNSEMARWLNVHEDYFSRIFRDITEITPNKYVRLVRHQEAKRLLQLTDWKIETISSHIGYENIHYFSKIFHKMEGVTARDYRTLTNLV